MQPVLTNPRSDRVRMVRSLTGRSARQRHQQYLIEGPQAVREVVRYAPDHIRTLYLTGIAGERYPEIVAEAHDNSIMTQLCSDEVIVAMSGDCQGLLAVAAIEPATLTQSIPLDSRLVVILHEVRDPGNAGTIIRTADAAGADAVILTGHSVEITSPKTVRSTAGSLYHLPVIAHRDLAEVIAHLHELGYSVLATAADGTQSIDELSDQVVAARLDGHVIGPEETDLRRRTAWLFGNEAHGLAVDEQQLADATTRIDIRGNAESLNLATAAAVCLFASSRAHR